MPDIPYKKTLDPKTKAILIIILLLILGTISGLILSCISINFVENRIEPANQRMQQYIHIFKEMYTLHTTVICINIFLLLGLLGIYVSSFRKTHSSFLLGLTLFISVLFIQSVLSLQVLQATVEFLRNIPGIFGILPNFFETIALTILLYLSME